MRLESHDHYHLSHPLLKAIGSLQIVARDLGTSCFHPVQIAIGKPEELATLESGKGGIVSGFCYLTSKGLTVQRTAGAASGYILSIILRC